MVSAANLDPASIPHPPGGRILELDALEESPPLRCVWHYGATSTPLLARDSYPFITRVSCWLISFRTVGLRDRTGLLARFTPAPACCQHLRAYRAALPAACVDPAGHGSAACLPASAGDKHRFQSPYQRHQALRAEPAPAEPGWHAGGMVIQHPGMVHLRRIHRQCRLPGLHIADRLKAGCVSGCGRRRGGIAHCNE